MAKYRTFTGTLGPSRATLIAFEITGGAALQRGRLCSCLKSIRPPALADLLPGYAASPRFERRTAVSFPRIKRRFISERSAVITLC